MRGRGHSWPGSPYPRPYAPARRRPLQILPCWSPVGRSQMPMGPARQLLAATFPIAPPSVHRAGHALLNAIHAEERGSRMKPRSSVRARGGRGASPRRLGGGLAVGDRLLTKNHGARATPSIKSTAPGPPRSHRRAAAPSRASAGARTGAEWRGAGGPARAHRHLRHQVFFASSPSCPMGAQSLSSGRRLPAVFLHANYIR